MTTRKPDKVSHNLKFVEPDLEIPYSEIKERGRTFRLTAGTRMAIKRIATFLDKEPTTLTWIDSFTANDMFVDVGANVGLYTVYAAIVAKCRVAAFEPESQNYAELNKNIHLNGLHKLVRAYCCAITDSNGMDALYLSRFAPSFSHHDFGENRWEGPVTRLGPDAASRPIQGCMGLRLDTCVEEEWIPMPTHIKVDVDGLEHKVIAGATKCLRMASLKTILVETNFKVAGNRGTMKTMEDLGWKYSMAQVCTTRNEGMITETLWRHRRDNGIGGCNIIYFKAEDAAKYEKIFNV